jgi:hypothetical protein
MGFFTNNADASTPNLTAEDRREFLALDAVVRRGVEAAQAVMDAGRALQTIRDRQLYRLVSTTWDAYVTERHGMTRRRADQLVAAAAALDAVREAVEARTGTVVPDLNGITERTARQLVGMDADLAADAVIEAAASPAGITPSSVRKAAAKRRKSKASKVARPRRYRIPGATVTVTPNRKFPGSFIDALTAALTQAEDQLEAENRQAEAA